MSGPLIGWLPLGKPVQADSGRHLLMDAGSVDDWAVSLDLVPVLLGHDPHRPVGWVTRARVTTCCLYLFGELDDTFDPRSRAAGHVIRSGIVQGLSPLVTTHPGSRVYGDGRWGSGDVYWFPELSVVGTPRVPRAHWEAPSRGQTPR